MRYSVKDLTLILPAYNAEMTINDTLDSLASNISNGMHLIIVDDASEDSTPVLVDNFASQWKTVTVIRQKTNIGLGLVRNLATVKVKTPLLAYIDADDWVDPQFYPTLIESFNSFPDLDFVRSHWIECTNYKRKFVHAAFPIVERPFDPKWGILPINKSTLVDQPHAVAGIYSTDFIINNSINFLPLRTAEDRKFIWQKHLLARKGIVANECRYFYRRGNPKSLTSVGDARQLDFIPAMSEMLSFVLTPKYIPFHDKAIRQTLAICCFHIENSCRLLPTLAPRMKDGIRELFNSLPPKALRKNIDQLDQHRKKLLDGL